jgi:pyruvate formate lyase activating enzyme
VVTAERKTGKESPVDGQRTREAALYEKLEGGRVECNTCERHCQIGTGKLGFCKTRKNMDGKLFTLVYGDISSVSANPIEKKPFFHFWPGSKALTVGTWSCNFDCPWCQNHDVSKFPQRIGEGRYISPEDFVTLMKSHNCQGTSISFNEPTLLLEYSLDVFHLAKREGCYNTYVTNGHMSTAALTLLIEHGLDAMNIDVKGGAEAVREYCKADAEYVWRNAGLARQHNIWIELTTLVIPGVNDDEECLHSIAGRIVNELGSATPWHVTRYYPAYRFASTRYVPPTTVASLENAYEIGKEEGLDYVYVGNLPGHPYENTYCPHCGKLLMERYGFGLTRYSIGNDKTCPDCQAEIPIIDELSLS